MLFSPEGARRFGGATVRFEPGARTAWHSHPAGQTLVVTEGSGWVQVEGEPRQDLRPGDVVWTPPGQRHWHGATDSAAMTHIALQGEVDGEVVDWQEPVPEARYLDAGAP
ncbi:MAG: cupin domain-containing protein [Alphaproteobacteria bacterium]|nr:cupin domain-containing protein [Alphaproteobacteria bacterium]